MVRSIPQLEQPLEKWLISCGECLQTLSMLTLPPAKFSSRKKKWLLVSCHDSSIFCVTYLKHFKDKQNLRILRVWNHLSCLTRAMTLTCLYFRRLNTELCQRLLFLSNQASVKLSACKLTECLGWSDSWQAWALAIIKILGGKLHHHVSIT